MDNDISKSKTSKCCVKSKTFLKKVTKTKTNINNRSTNYRNIDNNNIYLNRYNCKNNRDCKSNYNNDVEFDKFVL